jgi:TRAP-type C4-dicarboxylate transport system permease small subunit
MTGNPLKIFSDRLSTGMEAVAGAALVAVMLLSGWDIVGRAFGHPVPGAYEIISLAGGLVTGLAVPITSRVKGHVVVDLLLARLSGKIRFATVAATRLIGALTFVLMGYGSVMMGMRLREAGEVTAALGLPFYPVAFALAGAFFIEALILLAEITELRENGDE